MILTLGAGSVSQLGPMILERCDSGTQCSRCRAVACYVRGLRRSNCVSTIPLEGALMRLTAAFLSCAAVESLFGTAVSVGTEIRAHRSGLRTHDFHFKSGETLPELRLHYTTLGKPERDSAGNVTNAVLILHGTGGSGHQFLAPQFADVLFGPGQLLDANRYFIILPDDIGHGKSSKPSDGLHAHFPQYDYDDMVAAQHELLEKGLGVNHLRLRHGHVDGLHALLGVGRDLSRFHGCADAAGLSARADRRAQPHVAQDGDGGDPPGSGLEERRIQERTARRAPDLGGFPADRRQRAAADAEESPDARCGRQVSRRIHEADHGDARRQRLALRRECLAQLRSFAEAAKRSRRR